MDNNRTAVDFDGMISATDTVQLQARGQPRERGINSEVDPGYLAQFSTFVANSAKRNSWRTRIWVL